MTKHKTVPDTPRALWQVELTNHCPYSCTGCPRPRSRRPTGMMAPATFRACIKAVEQVQKDIRPLGLHHFGESLLHPDLHRFIAYAADRQVPTQLSCNGELLSAELAEALLRAGLDRMTFNLDGIDDKTVKSIRGPRADYARARENIVNFLDIRSRLASHCQVRLQMIAYKANAHQRAAFLREWAGFQVYAYIKKFDSWTIPELRNLGTEAMEVDCPFADGFAVVLWDGRIVPCCHDCDGEVILGSIHDGLRACGNSPAYRLFRRDVREGALPDGHLCRRCAWR